MIDKIKKTFNSVNDIEAIKNEIVDIKKELNSTLSFIKKFNQESIKSLNDKNILLDEKIKLQDELNNKINKTSIEFEKELNEFKTMRTRLQTTIANQVSNDIKKELNVYIMNVKHHVESLNNTCQEIKQISSNTGKVVQSIDYLNQISKSIKKEDFELSKYAKELEKNDREKLELLRRIDSLERLLSKLRKQGR
ncbi:MAG: hypothetical protein ACMXYG_02285 [Candidatus Woesearchaeota archaeon]